MFETDHHGNLELKVWKIDDVVDNQLMTYFYRSAYSGDSGSPMSHKRYPKGKDNSDTGEERHTIVAVLYGGTGVKDREERAIYEKKHNTTTRGPPVKCHIMVTKVTADIIAWIKRMNDENPAAIPKS